MKWYVYILLAVLRVNNNYLGTSQCSVRKKVKELRTSQTFGRLKILIVTSEATQEITIPKTHQKSYTMNLSGWQLYANKLC
jgi:hypothetical protein